uniref:Uncharacterized protein n=1 Tax=Rhizophora mucronata TaxID=61149 RepID=A0A2P2IJF0_RHIMU
MLGMFQNVRLSYPLSCLCIECFVCFVCWNAAD